METPKSVIVLLTLGLVVLGSAAVASSQGDAGQAPQAESRKPSYTRSASAIVKITADPEIIRLDDDTIFKLLQYSGIARKAAREALGQEAVENTTGWINVEWPSQSIHRVAEPRAQPSSTPESQDRRYSEMLRQLQEVYVRQMKSLDSKAQEKRDEIEFGANHSMEQAVTFVLHVQLPEDVRPAAEEFLKAAVDHLRTALLKAYSAHEEQIHQQLKSLESWREKIEDDYLVDTGARSPAQMQVQEQLDTIVDLSTLSPQMPLSDAFEALQRSVEPPLQIVALWRDLLENAYIEPSTPIDMGSLPQVKLSTALDTLLKAVGDSTANLAYRIKDSVITVGTAESLADRAGPVARSTGQADIETLDTERRELSRQIRGLELELTGLKARQKAIANQISIIRNQTHKRLAEDTVTQELQKLVQVSINNLKQVEKLQESGRANELEMAKLREALARANIELARREEELSKSAGGGQIEQFNAELSRIEIDTAEKQAQLDVLRRQLEEIRQEIASATAFDPQAARLSVARKTMDTTERRIAELKNRLMTLQEPTVTIITAN